MLKAGLTKNFHLFLFLKNFAQDILGGSQVEFCQKCHKFGKTEGEIYQMVERVLA